MRVKTGRVCRIGRLRYKETVAGLQRCRTGRLQDRTVAGQDGCRTVPDRKVAGQEGCRIGRLQDSTG